jgi:hypothetical protein
MKHLLLAALAAITVSTTALAQTKPAPKAPAAPVQEKCPITGDKLGSMGDAIEVAYSGKTAAFKGKKIKVCCGGCVGGVNKDQEKYFKAAFAPAKPSVAAKPVKPAKKG